MTLSGVLDQPVVAKLGAPHRLLLAGCVAIRGRESIQI
jgi:hypothetical protein